MDVVEASLCELEAEEKLCLDEVQFRKILKKAMHVNFWWIVFAEADPVLRLVTEEMLNSVMPFPKNTAYLKSFFITAPVEVHEGTTMSSCPP